MRTTALALLAVLACAAPSRGAAQAPATGGGATPDPRPLVLVVDPGRARVSSDRLLRAIASATARDVVRITDARARDPIGTLTIAYEGPGAWLVRFDSGGRSAIAHERITRPGALDARLSSAAQRVIAELETARAAEAPARAPASSSFADEAMYIAWADEILDPFAGIPAPPRREVAIFSEVIDPFAPPGASRSAWSEVLDPWDR